MAEDEDDLDSSGIFKLTNVLKGHLELMDEREEAVEKLISKEDTADDLRAAKNNAIEVEKVLLKKIMNDLGELNDFLKNIILIENLFNKLYREKKKEQEECRNQFAPGLAKFDSGAAKQVKTVKSEAKSFVTLMFGASNALGKFQKWLDEKVIKLCKEKGIKMKEERPKAKLKGMERAFYKSFYVYGKEDNKGYEKMTDLVRVSLVFNTFEDLYKCFNVIETVSEQSLGGILRVKDRFHPPSVPFGYRDMLINVMCPQSKIVAEVQLHHILFYKHKKISHTMYKKARLFQRGKRNLAYEYADKYERPKMGTEKIYQLPEEEGGDDEKGYDSSYDEDYKTKLNKWGLARYADKFDEEGYDDPMYWGEITEEELKDAIGMKPGHLRKWKDKIETWKKKLALKAERENGVGDDDGGDDGGDDDGDDAKEEAPAKAEPPKETGKLEAPLVGNPDFEPECDEGHRLKKATYKQRKKIDSGYESGWYCDWCGEEQPVKADNWRCKRCGWDLCQGCYDRMVKEESHRLENTHKVESESGYVLEFYTQTQLRRAGYSDGWGCDVCEKGPFKKKGAWHCEKSGWDACNKCYNKKVNGEFDESSDESS